MCGIAGFCDFTKKTDKQTLVNMTDILHHRGPDDSGYSFYENEYANIGLGHRRLSILDLSTHGHQPMNFEELEIVYNGEVYNFHEIAKELEDYGYTFESHSDTEVIIKAYHKWGIKAVDKFIGMFAIVIYDKELQKLIIIRDRAGVKPFHYYWNNNLFLFSSELRSFHEHPKFEKEINKDALALFFQYGYILEPYTIFKYTHKLQAGYYAELDLKNSEFKISVVDQRSNFNGIMSWDGNNLSLQNVPTSADIQSGDRIVSSSYGTLFPPLISVGIAAKKEQSIPGLLSSVYISPFVNLDRIKNVFVVKIVLSKKLHDVELNFRREE